MSTDTEALAAWKLELARRLRENVARDPVVEAAERREAARQALLPKGDTWTAQALEHERAVRAAAVAEPRASRVADQLWVDSGTQLKRLVE